MTTSYINGNHTEIYRSEAFGYLSDNMDNIRDVADILDVSAGAIAGIMAEENDDYSWEHAAFDELAKLLITARLGSSDIDELNEALEQGHEQFDAWKAAHPTFFDEVDADLNQRWREDYEAIADRIDVAADWFDKYTHPTLIDAGPGNFKIATAIRLVNKYADEYPELHFEKYLNNYGQLVDDLMDDEHPVTAQLYGLYFKEAEEWFRSDDVNAYGDQWDNLPQEFRDALLVTYANVGETVMEEKRQSVYLNRHLPYEPQPGLTFAGGVNHLRNAQAIGASIGLTDYGTEVVGVDDMLDDALQDDDLGIASRYALYRLRYVAVTDIDYSDYNSQGQLDLYDPLTPQGEMTQNYLTDRVAFTNMLLSSYLYGNSQLEGEQAIEFKDETTGDLLAIRNDRDHITQRFSFGGSQDDTLNGGGDDDHLYGGLRDDHLLGGGGRDYLEGNAGIDLLEGGAGSDELHGGAGTDRINGGEENDYLEGNAISGRLVGGISNDTLDGEGINGTFSCHRPLTNSIMLQRAIWI